MTLSGQEPRKQPIPLQLCQTTARVLLWSWARGVSDPCNSKSVQAQSYAMGTSWLQDKLIQVRNQPVTEESAGSSYVVPAMCICVPLT